MARLLLSMTLFLVVAAAALSLQSCKSPTTEPVQRAPATDLVVLPDGATMIAKPGSLEREIAEWVAEGRGAEARFHIATEAFEKDGTTLSPRALGQMARIADILKAAPDTRLIFRTDGEGPSEQRANALARFLEQRGIAKSRLRIMPATEQAAVTNGFEFDIRRSVPAGTATG
jgi:outer membrane protein OmpA-like peptidoglycan-associated protein